MIEGLLGFLKLGGKLLFRIGLSYSVFFYVAEFTSIQSIILTLLALCSIDAYRSISKSSTTREARFEPFCVTIHPNWYAICHDFNLTNLDKWDELLKNCETASGTYSVFKNGISFTMLSQTLYYSDDSKCFFGELDMNLSIAELTPPANTMFDLPTQLYVKRTLAGPQRNVPAIEFGLVTGESLKKSNHPLDNQGNIALATLPDIVFLGFVRPNEYNHDTIKPIEELTKDQLKSLGWTQTERYPESSWMNRPFEVKHKYFCVRYRGLAK